jgi:hypothetical protein
MSAIMHDKATDTATLEGQLGKASTLEQRLAAFGDILELGEPVSPQVLFAALQDSTYARNLLVSRRSPPHLHYLLSNPPAVDIPDQHMRMPSNGELVKSAATALFKWAKTGFSTVDEATLERRENACLNCPHLVAATRILQKIVPSGKTSTEIGRRTGDKVCDLCGCSLKRKMRLTSESCPGKDPDRPEFTRWGEATG